MIDQLDKKKLDDVRKWRITRALHHVGMPAPGTKNSKSMLDVEDKIYEHEPYGPTSRRVLSDISQIRAKYAQAGSLKDRK